MVATKLGIVEFRHWIENELNGYSKGSDVPSYRKVRSELKAHNPYHGWIPVIIEAPEIAKGLSQRKVAQPISQLEALCYKDSERGVLQIRLPHDLLMRFFGNSEEFDWGMIPTLIVDQSQLLGILDAVRSEVLNWSLELEKQDILGEGNL